MFLLFSECKVKAKNYCLQLFQVFLFRFVRTRNEFSDKSSSLAAFLSDKHKKEG